MEHITNLITTMATSIVDEVSSVEISVTEDESGLSYEIRVSKNDTGKLIGKQGRVASALRTVAKAAGAKSGVRVQVNVSKTPVGHTPVAESPANGEAPDSNNT
tara:strand:- start:153 stop:461 length:309 start_codon:yes stop_codon:yes gene_type:complete